MRHAPFAGLAVLALLAAGCLAPAQQLDTSAIPWLDRVSQPLFNLTKAPLQVLAGDGKRLDAFVYRPEAPPGVQVPAIIMFSPYFANGESQARTDNIDAIGAGSSFQLVDYFVPRGYAVVATSVRGTGYSEGCFSIGGPQESKDHVAVVEAIIAQPWSNGAVAAYGASYVGTTANDLATEGHPAVKTIVPISAAKGWYHYNFINGVPVNPQGYSFNYYYERDVAITPPYGNPDAETIHLAAEEAQCDHTETQLGGLESAPNGDKTAYWVARDYYRDADQVIAPVFLIHGLQDWNVKDDNLDPWLPSLEQRVPTKVWLGQWAHNRPNANSYREAWTRGDWNVTLLRWFDHWLKGIDTGILQEPMVDVQDSSGVWRHETSWPPARAVNLTLYLADGALQAAPGSGAVAWQDTSQGIPKPPSAGALHYALFASAPLASDLHISGVGHLLLNLEHSAPRGTLAATLWDLAPNGTSQRINFGYFDLRHRGGLETSQDVQPGQAFDLDVPLIPQDDLVPAGHQLLLTLAGNDSPTCWYTTVDPVALPPPVPPDVNGLTATVGLASFVCVPDPSYDDPGPLMQPIPSGGTTTLHLGEGTALVLPTLPSIAPFAPPTEQDAATNAGGSSGRTF